MKVAKTVHGKYSALSYSITGENSDDFIFNNFLFTFEVSVSSIQCLTLQEFAALKIVMMFHESLR